MVEARLLADGFASPQILNNFFSCNNCVKIKLFRRYLYIFYLMDGLPVEKRML